MAREDGYRSTLKAARTDGEGGKADPSPSPKTASAFGAIEMLGALLIAAAGAFLVIGTSQRPSPDKGAGAVQSNLPESEAAQPHFISDSSEKDRGDWFVDPDFPVANVGSACGIARVDGRDLTASKFQIMYSSKPLILTHMFSNWTGFRTWEKKLFVTKYGHLKVFPAEPTSLAMYGPTQLVGDNVTIANYLASDNCRVHGNVVVDKAPPTGDRAAAATAVAEDNKFACPKIFGSGMPEKSLHIYPSRSGLPLHSHGQCWLGVVRGKLRWYLYPPDGFPPEVYRHSGELECAGQRCLECSTRSNQKTCCFCSVPDGVGLVESRWLRTRHPHRCPSPSQANRVYTRSRRGAVRPCTLAPGAPEHWRYRCHWRRAECPGSKKAPPRQRC